MQYVKSQDQFFRWIAGLAHRSSWCWVDFLAGFEVIFYLLVQGVIRMFPPLRSNKAVVLRLEYWSDKG